MSNYKFGTRRLRYRAEIMEGEIGKGELRISDLSISLRSDAEAKRSASFSCVDSSLMDWNKNYVSIWLEDEEEEVALGIFIPQHIEKEYCYGKGVLRVEAYDRSVLLQQDKILNRLHFEKGSSYLSAVRGVLMSAGLTKIIQEDSGAVFQSDRDDWDVGTSKIKIVNQLLEEMSFKSLEIDETGTARLKKYVQPSIESVVRSYSSGEASVIMPETQITTNVLEVPNVWIATVSNPDLDKELTATYINDNPLSCTSTVYTGQKKVCVLSGIDNTASQTDLQNAVNKAAYSGMQGEEIITYTTAIVLHGIGEVVSIELPEFSGIVVETEWNMDFQSCEMEHTAKRTVAL